MTEHPKGASAHALLEEVYAQALERGQRDDPLMVRVGEALEALKPAPAKAEPSAKPKGNPPA
jgi:hypothetical protein